MSIDTASILVDGTVGITGGTATGFLVKSTNNNEKVVVLNDSSEFINQTSVSFKINDPKPSSSSPNGYTQARTEVRIKRPLLLDNGDYTVNTCSAQLSVDHETTDAEVESLKVLLCNLIMDTDFSDLWSKQSLG